MNIFKPWQNSTRVNERVFWVLAILLAAILVGMMNQADRKEAKTLYCDNVRLGVWPDYRGTYKEECGGKDPPKFDANLTK